MDDDELGRTVHYLGSTALSTAQQLERTVVAVLASALGISHEAAAAIGGNSGIGRMEGMIRTLANAGESKVASGPLLEWADKLKPAIKARNKLIHQMWMGSGREPDVLVTRTYEQSPVSIEDYKALIQTMIDAIWSAPR